MSDQTKEENDQTHEETDHHLHKMNALAHKVARAAVKWHELGRNEPRFQADLKRLFELPDPYGVEFWSAAQELGAAVSEYEELTKDGEGK